MSVPFPSEQSLPAAGHPLHSSPGAEYLTCTNIMSESSDSLVETAESYFSLSESLPVTNDWYQTRSVCTLTFLGFSLALIVATKG